MQTTHTDQYLIKRKQTSKLFSPDSRTVKT